jgi:hypothetical protein
MDRIRTRIKTNYGNRFRDRQRKAEQEQDHKIFRTTGNRGYKNTRLQVCNQGWSPASPDSWGHRLAAIGYSMVPGGHVQQSGLGEPAGGVSARVGGEEARGTGDTLRGSAREGSVEAGEEQQDPPGLMPDDRPLITYSRATAPRRSRRAHSVTTNSNTTIPTSSASSPSTTPIPSVPSSPGEGGARRAPPTTPTPQRGGTPCPLCSATLKNERGLAIHWRTKHPGISMPHPPQMSDSGVPDPSHGSPEPHLAVADNGGEEEAIDDETALRLLLEGTPRSLPSPEPLSPASTEPRTRPPTESAAPRSLGLPIALALSGEGSPGGVVTVRIPAPRPPAPPDPSTLERPPAPAPSGEGGSSAVATVPLSRFWLGDLNRLSWAAGISCPACEQGYTTTAGLSHAASRFPSPQAFRTHWTQGHRGLPLCWESHKARKEAQRAATAHLRHAGLASARSALSRRLLPPTALASPTPRSSLLPCTRHTTMRLLPRPPVPSQTPVAAVAPHSALGPLMDNPASSAPAPSSPPAQGGRLPPRGPTSTPIPDPLPQPQSLSHLDPTFAHARAWALSADFSPILGPDIRPPRLVRRLYHKSQGVLQQCFVVVQQHMAAFQDEPAYHYLLFALPRLLWRTSSGGAAAQCRAIVKRGRAFL